MRTLPRTALAAALALLVFPAAASAARQMEVAIQDEPVFLQQGYFDREQAFQRAADLRVTRIRANVLWSKVLGPQANLTTAPLRPVYDWSRFDNLIDAAARHGIRVQLSLTTPAP